MGSQANRLFQHSTTMSLINKISSFQSLVEDWPLCDCFLAFHSTGFPVEKAIAYAKLRKPYIVNNLEIQYDIQDRRRVYQILEEAGIEIPSYAILDRDDPTSKFIKQQQTKSSAFLTTDVYFFQQEFFRNSDNK